MRHISFFSSCSRSICLAHIAQSPPQTLDTHHELAQCHQTACEDVKCWSNWPVVLSGWRRKSSIVSSSSMRRASSCCIYLGVILNLMGKRFFDRFFLYLHAPLHRYNNRFMNNLLFHSTLLLLIISRAIRHRAALTIIATFTCRAFTSFPSNLV